MLAFRTVTYCTENEETPNLSTATGVPLPFDCHFAAEIPDEVNLEKLEKTLHQLFAERRINPKREFFKVEPEKIVLALSIGGFKEVTPGKNTNVYLGKLMEYGNTDQLFTKPSRKETEDYITGRFG